MRRQLYTDDETFIRSFRRCSLLNGIGISAWRPDLLDRALIFETPLLTERYSEDEISELWHVAKPGILGGFFTAISQAMSLKDKIPATTEFRMADFSCWALALAEPLGFTREDFENSYRMAIKEKWHDAAEASILGQAVIDLVDSKSWEGTCSELLEALPTTNQKDEPRKGMPQSAIALGRELKRLAPVLRNNGLDVEVKRGNDRRICLSTNDR